MATQSRIEENDITPVKDWEPTGVNLTEEK